MEYFRKPRLSFSPLWDQVKQLWLDFQNSDPSFRMKIWLAIACTVVSLWVGYAYSDQIGIVGWQFWTWLACVVCIVALLFTTTPLPSKPDLFILFSLIAAAIAIRLPNLDTVPGLFHGDEAGLAEFARDALFADPIMRTNPFITGPASQPTIYHYLQHYSMLLFGNTIAGARMSSVILGSIAVAATYLMIKSISGKKVALFSAIMMVAYHFSVHYSKVALNNIWDTLWVPLIIYSFTKGWEKRWLGGAVICGIALGFSQYFYHGSKIALFILAMLIITRWKENSNTSQKVGFVATIAIVSLCVAGPIFLFSFANPAIFYSRLNDGWGWKPIAIEMNIGEVNYWKYFWHQLQYSLGTYVVYPDPSGFYAPGIPLVIGLEAVLFVCGIAIALVKKNWIPIVWIVLTALLGGFLLSVPNSSAHYVVAIPAICWLVGLAINLISESGHSKIAILVLVIIVLIDIYFYYGIYAHSMPRDFNVPFPPLR